MHAQEQCVRTLLADYAELLNRFGPDSEEAFGFLEEHKDNSELHELASISRMLKKALTAPVNRCYHTEIIN